MIASEARPAPPGQHRPARRNNPAALGAVAMILVGSSAAVSGTLADAPLLLTQALRYAVAAALLIVSATATQRRVVVPAGPEWLWLGGVASAGRALFNMALVRGVQSAEPAPIRSRCRGRSTPCEAPWSRCKPYPRERGAACAVSPG